MEDNKKDSKYSPEEVAMAVLAKAHDLLKDSTLSKANTAHEIEAGEEPRNDDAEAPEYLANADIENADGGNSEGGEEKKKKKAEGSEEEMMEDEEEENESPEEEMMEDETEESDEEEPDFGKYQKSEEMDKCGDIKMDKSVHDIKTGKEIDAKEGKKRNEIAAEAAAKAAKTRKAKKAKSPMAKSEGEVQTDGITKVYEFLAKSYGKKKDLNLDKKKKKEKLKKMAMAPQEPQGPKDAQGLKPQQDAMEPPKGATGMKGY